MHVRRSHFLSRLDRLAALTLTALVAAACGPPRSIDGSGNHLTDPALGMAGSPLIRWMDPDYGDGMASMAGSHRPSPRAISNTVHAQTGSRPDRLGASDYLWQWGQFLDHDIDLTGDAFPAELAPIPVPAGDPYFDPFATGLATIGFSRSLYDPTTGGSPSTPRAQINQITAFIDASQVYGSDPVRARALRTLDGTGRLRTSPGNLLPFNDVGLPNAGGNDDGLFLAGDVRANEQVGLTAMHTLFVREHNRVARMLAAKSDLQGDEIYEAARRWVGALMQSITYNEYLPALLGPYAPDSHATYDPDVDPRISTIFSTALFRLGHSQLSPKLLRMDGRMREIEDGHLSLADAFFDVDAIVEQGIDPLLRGLAAQRAQQVDVYVIDEVRNFLFGPPGAGGFDLASLNLQRGRDHGLPSYNDARHGLGLGAVSSYDEISSDPEVRARLEAAYGPGRVDDVDLWTGALAEDPLPDAHVGPLIATALARQFEALRDGDRYFYRGDLPAPVVMVIESLRLSDVIRMNTRIGRELQDDVFHVRSARRDRGHRRHREGGVDSAGPRDGHAREEGGRHTGGR